MSDEPASSASTRSQPHRSFAIPENGEPISTQDGYRAGSSREAPEVGDISSNSSSMSREHRREREKMAHNRRIDCIDELLSALDALVYVELVTTYYLDNSFFYLFIRSIVQFIHLTPKPAQFPSLPPRPYIASILGVNLICTCIHVFFSPLSASTSSPARGYLHGSLAIDFVGQRAPRSRLQLIGLDILVCGLQMVMLAATLRRTKLKKRKLKRPNHISTGQEERTAGITVTVTTGPATATEPGAGEDGGTDDEQSDEGRGSRVDLAPERRRRLQDLDFEERGLLRRASTFSGGSEPSNDDHPETSRSGDTIARDTETEPTMVEGSDRREDDPMDAMASGQAIVTELNVPRMMRRQWRAARAGPGRRLGGSGG